MMYPALAMVFWAAGRHRKKPAEIRRRRVSAASEPDAACGPEEGAEELTSLCGLVYLRESNGQTRTDESAKAARCFRLFILPLSVSLVPVFLIFHASVLALFFGFPVRPLRWAVSRRIRVRFDREESRSAGSSQDCSTRTGTDDRNSRGIIEWIRLASFSKYNETLLRLEI